jgi:hypothetical protein
VHVSVSTAVLPRLFLWTYTQRILRNGPPLADLDPLVAGAKYQYKNEIHMHRNVNRKHCLLLHILNN